MFKKEQDEPPGNEHNGKLRKWREWHERETPIYIDGKSSKSGIRITVKSPQLNTNIDLCYPNSVWQNYRKENKVKLIDNLTYIFTAHLPFLLKGNIRLEYNTGYPHTFSWANQAFMRFLPAYWYFCKGIRGSKIYPLLKTLLNSRSTFAETKDEPPRFPETIDESVVIPFTFGKDSFLTYHIAKAIGLKPQLVYFNEPTELYSREHKLNLIEAFSKKTKEKIYFMDNPLGNLREFGEGWFGWELALTSWTLLSLPFAFKYKAGYILFSNEKSTNAFFYDKEGFKVIPDYDQGSLATEELSIISQALSEGEVYTATFLQGLDDLGIVAILKNKFRDSTFPYLMSCWAETEEAKHKRWCANCSKCARMYVYLTANGIDPIKEAGFKDNMFARSKAHLYNVFGSTASGTGWDAFGLNTDEQALAFYLTYLRGIKGDLIEDFAKTEYFKAIKKNFQKHVDNFFSLSKEQNTPLQWKKQISRFFKEALKEEREKIYLLRKKVK